MTSKDIMALTDQYIMHTYGRFPVAIDHGEGATLYDPEGNAYIDFTRDVYKRQAWWRSPRRRALTPSPTAAPARATTRSGSSWPSSASLPR